MGAFPEVTKYSIVGMVAQGAGPTPIMGPCVPMLHLVLERTFLKNKLRSTHGIKESPRPDEAPTSRGLFCRGGGWHSSSSNVRRLTWTPI